MKKFTTTSVIVLLVAGVFVLASSHVSAQGVTNGGDDVSGTGSGQTAAVGTTGTVTNGQDDGSHSPALTGPVGTTGTVTNGQDDGPSSPGGTTPDGTDIDDDTPGGGGPGGPGGPGSTGNPGGSSGTGSGSVILSQGTTGSGTTFLPNSCPLITSKLLKLGGANNPVDVAKLQAFLKNSEKLDVTVNGTFDLQTENAVRAFQKKYVSEILIPWGGPKTSGIAYITTLKKINQLVCAQPLTLSSAELAIINAFKANRLAGLNASSTIGSDIDLSGSVDFGTTTGDESDDESNTASAGNSSIAARFWNFIKNLFR